MKHLLPCLLVVSSLGSACATERGESEPKRPNDDAKPPSDDTKPPSDDAKPSSDAGERRPDTRTADGPRLRSTADQAKAAGLPPLPFSLDLGDSGMSGSGPGDGHYLTLSGPPGGPLMLRISAAKVGDDPASLVRGGPIEGKAEQVELLGAKRAAVAWTSGESMARTSWCGIIVAPEGSTKGAAALLLELGVGHRGDEITCTTALQHHVLGPVVQSLKLE